jgi:hypothetical protein
MNNVEPGDFCFLAIAWWAVVCIFHPTREPCHSSQTKHSEHLRRFDQSDSNCLAKGRTTSTTASAATTTTSVEAFLEANPHFIAEYMRKRQAEWQPETG